MAVPLKDRWFGDYVLGEVFEFGHYLVTQDEIIEFAKRYDPQTFHTDPVAAKNSIFAGLVGSGWMSTAIAMRMMCDDFLPVDSALGSPGVDHLRWLTPVRPGDTLHMRATVIAVKPSRSKPGRGVLTIRQELMNQNHQIVMSLEGKSMHMERPCD